MRASWRAVVDWMRASLAVVETTRQLSLKGQSSKAPRPCNCEVLEDVALVSGGVYVALEPWCAVSVADICTALRLAMSAVLLLPAYAETDLPVWASPGCPSVLLPVVWLNPVVSCVRLYTGVRPALAYERHAFRATIPSSASSHRAV